MLKQKKKCSKCSKWFYRDNRIKTDGTIFIYKNCLKCYRYREKYKSEEYQKEYQKKYRKKSKDYQREYQKKYRQANIELMRERDKLRAKKRRLNPEYTKKQNERSLKDYHKKYKKDPTYRLNCCVSSQIRQSLYGNKQGRHWENLVDYTLDDLKKHLEKQFKPGMVWDNYGQWHIDHIIPKTAFNFDKPEHDDFKRCWALSNLQPLWANKNIKKSNKLKKPFQPSLKL